MCVLCVSRIPGENPPRLFLVFRVCVRDMGYMADARGHSAVITESTKFEYKKQS
jgi:hypothetical protein